MVSLNEIIIALWALEDVLSKNDLPEAQRDALILAVSKAILSKRRRLKTK